MSLFNNQLRAGVVLSYISLLLGNTVSLVYTPIMLRLLGQEEYGLYSMVAAFTSYLGLMDLGFSATYLRYYSQYSKVKNQDQVEVLNGLFFSIFSVLALLILISGLVLCQYSDIVFGGKLTATELATARKLMYLLVLVTAITFGTKIFEICIIANEQYIFVKLVGLLRNLFTPLLILPLLLLGYKSIGMVAISLVMCLIYAGLNIFYALRKLNFRLKFQRCDSSLYSEIASISIFVFIGEIVDMINWGVGKYILGKTTSMRAVAIYGVATQFLLYYRAFSSNISSVFTPRINQLIAKESNPDQLTALMIKVGRIQFIVLALMATGFIFYGKMFCCLWAGYEYETVYPITMLLMLPSTIPLIQNVGIAILIAKNKHKVRSYIYLAIALVNVVLMIPLSYRYGAIGCAVGTTISMVVGNGFIINWYYAKVGLDIGKFWKSILRLSLGLVLPILFGTVLLIDKIAMSWTIFFAMGMIYCLIYAVSMFFLGFNEYEKDLVWGGVRKFMYKFV